jgi:hypothetical protein
MDWDISGVFFYDNRILIVNSSSTVLFFKIELIKNPLIGDFRIKWNKFYEIPVTGFVEGVRGSNRF